MTTSFHVGTLPGIVRPSLQKTVVNKPEAYSIRSGTVLVLQERISADVLPRSVSQYPLIGKHWSGVEAVHAVYGIARDVSANVALSRNVSNMASCGLIQCTRTGVVDVQLQPENYKSVTKGHLRTPEDTWNTKKHKNELKVGHMLYASLTQNDEDEDGVTIITNKTCIDDDQHTNAAEYEQCRCGERQEQPDAVFYGTSTRIGQVVGWDDFSRTIRVKLAIAPLC